jgi:hypothetical protein
MAKNVIMEKDLNRWMKETWTIYASESVSDNRSHLIRRLRFEVNCSGSFRVSIGNQVLYEGRDLLLASAAYRNHGSTK